MKDKSKLFEAYFKEWLNYIEKPKIMISSRTEDYIKNEPYRKMLSLGEAALPDIIEKIKEGYFFLNNALSEITGVKISDILPKGVSPYSEQEISKYWIIWWNRHKSDYEETTSDSDDLKKTIQNISQTIRSLSTNSKLYGDDIISALKYFGLEEDDAKIYLGLLKTGAVTVGNLSTKLEVDRGRTYRALNKLRNFGLITTTLSNPTICKAVNPHEALKNIIQKKQDEIITMEKLSKQLTASLDELIEPYPVTESSYFLILQGRSNIYGRIGKIISEATNVVYIITTMDDIVRMSFTIIPERIKEHIKKGGVVRIVTQVEKDEDYEVLSKFTASEIRLGKLPSRGRIVVEEGKQAMMSGSMKGSILDLNDEAEGIVLTNSIDIVNNIQSLANHIWKKSEQDSLNSAREISNYKYE